MNLIELADTTRTEQEAVSFLQRKGLLHNPRCCGNGHDMILQLGGDREERWSCGKRTCREYKSIRLGTWFEGTRLSFRTIILFIYSWCHEYTSVKFCEKELNMSHCARVDWANYLREVCASELLENPLRIGGPGVTVELDESLFSRRKANAGRVLPQQWVFGGYCRDTKECFLCAVDNREAATLLPIIERYVVPGSTVMTDEWASYRRIGDLPGAYTHATVNHSQNFVDPQTGAHTQGVESTWRSLKRRNKLECGTSRELTDSYLCEFMWPSRHRNDDLFEKILEAIKNFMPPE